MFTILISFLITYPSPVLYTLSLSLSYHTMKFTGLHNIILLSTCLTALLGESYACTNLLVTPGASKDGDSMFEFNDVFSRHLTLPLTTSLYI